MGLDPVPCSGSQEQVEGEHIAEMCRGVAFPASLFPNQLSQQRIDTGWVSTVARKGNLIPSDACKNVFSSSLIGISVLLEMNNSMHMHTLCTSG